MQDILRQAQEKFSLLDRIPLGILVLDAEQTVLFWNDRLEEWTKIPRTEILGTHIDQRFPHFNQPQYTQRLRPIFEGGAPAVFSSQLHKHIIPAPLSRGRLRVQQTTVTAIPALDHAGHYAMFSIEDVTDLTFRVQEYRTMRDQAILEAKERQRAQEFAETANRVKDQFLAVVSHELRSPLNPILGWVRLMRQKAFDPIRTEQALTIIQRNAELQAQLVEDLLDVSRILQGKLVLNAAPVPLASVIRSALETVRLAAEAKKIQVHLNCDLPLQIQGDSGRLQQVVWNLLSNAIKFTPIEGSIDIHLTQVDSFAHIQVRDTGKGIEPDFLPHVFDYFRQADSSTTRNFGGLGLGLAIVRQIVEMHGGRVWAESEGEDQGSTFTVELPLLQTSNSTAPTADPDFDLDETPLANLRVLIVDDEIDSREFVAFVVEQAGAKITVASSAIEALQILTTESFDILLSDIGMPQMDGYALIEEIRLSDPRLPAIALTAYAGEVNQQKAIQSGFQSHLAKPVDPTEMTIAVARLCGRK